MDFFIIFILILIGFVTYFNLDNAPTSLKRIFKDSNLGNIKKVKVTSWNDNGKTLNFKARDINYKALIKENGEIYQIFVGTGENFPIYDVNNDDTVIDANEILIIKRMQDFIEKSSRNISGISPELEEKIKYFHGFPMVFKCRKLESFDRGKFYILKLKISYIYGDNHKYTDNIIMEYEVNFEKDTYLINDMYTIIK